MLSSGGDIANALLQARERRADFSSVLVASQTVVSSC